ncbi:MAG: DNA polymerase III subunit delta [bacterium]|nr:DNA polymerase III subunit delta [bacterium]
MSSHSLTPRELHIAVRKGKRFDVLLLKGSEEFLLRQALREYVAAVMPEDAAGLDFSEYRASDIDAGTLWNALTTMPLFSDRRLVVLDISRSVGEDVAGVIERYAARPSPNTSLAMTWITERKREGQTGKIGGETVEVVFRELKPDERIAWASGYLKEKGKRIEEDAAQYLIEISSSEIGDIAAKLDHICLYLGKEEEVTVPLLMEVAGVTSEYTVFQLEDAVLARKATEAHRIAHSLLDGGEPLLRMLHLHRVTLMRLWLFARLIQKNAAWQSSAQGKEAQEQIQKALGRQVFKMKSYRDAATHLGELRVREAVVGLLDVEIRAKSSWESDAARRYFEWLWNFCARTRRSAGTGIHYPELIG